MVPTRLREDALSIFQAGLRAADPAEAVKRFVRREADTLRVANVPYHLPEFRRIGVVGMGKASAAMAEPLTELLEDRIAGGVINVKYGHSRPLRGIRVNEAGHPVPDESGVAGTEEMMRFVAEFGTHDLLFCLISGGGSALSPAPATGLSLEDKGEITQWLLDSGATIHEINAVRKHLSRVKGGHLARLAHPAALLSLVLSDVIGDDMDTIASGPTSPDRSTYQDCLEVLGRLEASGHLPTSVLRHLEAGSRGEIAETPKPGDPAFERTQSVIVGSNVLALSAAKERASQLGYTSMILSSSLAGETREVARAHADLAKSVRETGQPVAPPACIISGGETTVTIRGTGKGGRNQEFALAGALGIHGLEGVVILSGGTDGTDGPTDAAGALADGDTVARARSKGIDPAAVLEDNDSYYFFQALGDLVVTGPTHTNVMDLRLVMVD